MYERKSVLYQMFINSENFFFTWFSTLTIQTILFEMVLQTTIMSEMIILESTNYFSHISNSCFLFESSISSSFLHKLSTPHLHLQAQAVFLKAQLGIVFSPLFFRQTDSHVTVRNDRKQKKHKLGLHQS